MSDSAAHARLTIPNFITSLRLLLLPPFIASLVLQAWADPPHWSRPAAFGLFFFMSLTDLVDGLIARRLGQVSRLGALLDAIADKLLMTTSLILLHVLGVTDASEPPAPPFYAPWWVPTIAIAKDLSVTAGWTVLQRRRPGVRLGPGWVGKACTAVQMLLVLTMLLWFMRPALFEPIARGVFVIASAAAIATMVSYGRMAVRATQRHDQTKPRP